MATAILIRPLRPGDVPTVRALAPRLVEGAAVWRPAEGFAAAASRWLDESLAACDDDTRSRPVWVAELDGRVVGVATAELRRHFSGTLDCYLGELIVDATVEGRGIGRELLARAESWAREQGAGYVTLETGAGNARARGFYARRGYVEEQVQLTRVLPPPTETTRTPLS